ncbi:MAG: RluA family pseudouridine synthase [Actinomycetota bacterium]
MTEKRFTAEPGRLDVVVVKALGIARADVQRAIARGGVLVDGTPRPKSFRLAGGERVEVSLPDRAHLEPSFEQVQIAYSDEDLVVVSKPAGLLTHPTASHRSDTLVNRLIAMGVTLAPGDDPDRPGIVHRLDAGTSGLMVVASSARARQRLAEMFRRHEVDRHYLAMVRGRPAQDQFLIEAPLERRRARIRVGVVTGRAASTEVVVRQRFDRAALVEARPRTGRTHQIRVHLSAVGHSILGDRVYGGGGDDAKRLGLTRPFLHSWRIAFDHPVTAERIEVEDPLPDDLARALARQSRS